MTDIMEIVSRLSDRVRHLEDQAEIQKIVATYGPAVDSCSDGVLRKIWTEGGVYDTDRAVFEGADAMRALVSSAGHQAFYNAGCAHVMSSPHIVVAGDRAVAINYSRVYVHVGEDHWRVKRASANRWELERTPEGWRVSHRLVRNLNGRPEVPQEIFAQSLTAAM